MYPELKAQRNHSDQNSEFLGTDHKSQLVNSSGSQSLDQVAKTIWNLTFKIIAIGIWLKLHVLLLKQNLYLDQ